MFNDEVMKRFSHPKNAGDLKEFTIQGSTVHPDCSDIIEMKILLKDDLITNASFKVFGCPGAVSTTDLFIDLIKGKTITEALQVHENDIIDGLGGLPAESAHCARLPLEAFRNALDTYNYFKEKKHRPKKKKVIKK
jgi:NifU-like protein involved in Fe-S cluster formation